MVAGTSIDTRHWPGKLVPRILPSNFKEIERDYMFLKNSEIIFRYSLVSMKW